MKNLRFKTWSLALGLFLCLNSMGCVVVDAFIPEKPTILNGVKSIAIVGIDSIPGPDVQSQTCGVDFEEELTDALKKENRFIVVERKKIDKAIEQMKLNISDLFSNDMDKANQVGQLIGAQALIVGRVKVYKYEEDPIKKTHFTTKKFGIFGDETRHTEFTRTGRAKASVNFRVVNIATGAVLDSKSFYPKPVEKSVSADDNMPSKIDKDSLFFEIRKQIVEEYAGMLEPGDVSALRNKK